MAGSSPCDRNYQKIVVEWQCLRSADGSDGSGCGNFVVVSALKP